MPDAGMKVDPVPSGWSATTLADVVEPKRVKINPSAETNLPFIGMEHVEPHSLAPHSRSEFRTMKSAASHFMRGDVLYGRMRPYLNKVFRADFEGAGSAEFIVFPRSDHLDSDFLKYLLHQKSFVSFASHETSGDRPRIDFDDIKTFRFLLPPANQQRRIVAKIDELFSDIEEGERCLARAQELLKRYRQSVLKAAVTGELTRDWRDRAQRGKNAGKGETGADLLRRILAARRAAWEKSGRGRNYLEPEPPENSKLLNLPDGWKWSKIGVIGEVTGGVTKNPKRAKLSQTLPYLRVANVYANELRLDDMMEIGVEETELERAQLKIGDLLVVEGNGSIEQIGRVALWDGSIPKCIHQNHIIKVRFTSNILGPWALTWMLSPLGRAAIERTASSTSGLHTLSISKVASLEIPVPSEGEIVEALARVRDTTEEIEAEKAGLARQAPLVSALRQSILRAAFSGRLVAQDPSDEPAARLLERIAAERAQAADATGLRPRRRDARP